MTIFPPAAPARNSPPESYRVYADLYRVYVRACQSSIGQALVSDATKEKVRADSRRRTPRQKVIVKLSTEGLQKEEVAVKTKANAARVEGTSKVACTPKNVQRAVRKKRVRFVEVSETSNNPRALQDVADAVASLSTKVDETWVNSEATRDAIQDLSLAVATPAASSSRSPPAPVFGQVNLGSNVLNQNVFNLSSGPVTGPPLSVLHAVPGLADRLLQPGASQQLAMVRCSRDGCMKKVNADGLCRIHK